MMTTGHQSGLAVSEQAQAVCATITQDRALTNAAQSVFNASLFAAEAMNAVGIVFGKPGISMAYPA